MKDYDGNIPIRVVCATKLKKNQFGLSQTGKSLFALNKISPIQIRLYEENSIGLPELYNRAIEEVEGSPRPCWSSYTTMY
jgi:hypothetical protein